MQGLFLCLEFRWIVIKNADSPCRTSLCFTLSPSSIILLPTEFNPNHKCEEYRNENFIISVTDGRIRSHHGW